MLEPLAQLISRLSRLPGVGRRSAERMAYRLATGPATLRQDLVQALQVVQEQVVRCSRCGQLTLRTQDPCAICTDNERNHRWLCVVTEAAAIAQIEAAGVFRGIYHCLNGKLSPLNGTDLPPPKLAALLHRIRQEEMEEVLLALDADVESDATASYLQDQLAPTGARITHLAFGLPAGSGLAYSDPVTLARALHGRQHYGRLP